MFVIRKRSWLARGAALFGVCLILLAAGTGIDSYFATVFELDANVVTMASHDWDQVFADNSVTPATNTAGAIASAFITDGFGAGDNILNGGQTKDIYDFPNWGWKQTSTTSVQDKDDIEHAYAAAYTLPNGHTGIFFGADRFSNSGDSQMGFWFVQDPNVAINTTPSGGNTGGFNGHHIDGDLLIVAHFVNGGSIPQITLFTWSAAQNTIVQLGAVDNNLCDPNGTNNSVCAITNSGLFTPPWSFTEKSSDSPKGTGLFIEGGIDLQAFFPNAPCFNKFFAETRSSAQPSSTLSDFTVPVAFQLCSVAVNKSCATGTVATKTDGSNFVHYTFNGTVTSPSGTVFQPTVVDTFPSGATNMILNGASCASSPCTAVLSTGSLSSGGSGINFTGSFDMSAPLPASDATHPNGTNPNQIQALAAAADGGSKIVTSKVIPWTPNDASGGGCHIEVSGALSLAKGCTVNIVQSNGQLALQVAAEIRVCNTVSVSSGGVQLKGLTLTDNVFGTIGSNITLNAPNGTTQSGCLHFYPTYLPTSCTPTSDGRCVFSDTVTPSGTVTDDFGSTYALPTAASATCRVCPLGACSAVSDTPWPDNPTTFVKIVP